MKIRKAKNKLDFLFVSPSYRREPSTPDWLDSVGFMDKEDYDKYGHKWKSGAIVLEDGVQGNVGRVRNYIKDWVRKNTDYRYIVYVDDDSVGAEVHNFYGETHGDKKVPLNKDDLRYWIDWQIGVMDKLGISIGGGAAREDRLLAVNPFCLYRIPMGGCYMIHCLDFDLKFDEDLYLKEDYAMGAEVLKRYGITFVNNLISITTSRGLSGDGNVSGGCSSYRTYEEEVRQNKLLDKKYPGFFKFDVGRSGIDLNPRLNVREIKKGK